jgi:hypothetical protein
MGRRSTKGGRIKCINGNFLHARVARVISRSVALSRLESEVIVPDDIFPIFVPTFTRISIDAALDVLA